MKARYANVREYFSIRGEGLKQKTSAEWLDILEKADVPAGRVHSIDTLPGDEHLADVGLFRKVEHPVGRHQVRAQQSEQIFRRIA